jgi:hypothetical protein
MSSTSRQLTWCGEKSRTPECADWRVVYAGRVSHSAEKACPESDQSFLVLSARMTEVSLGVRAEDILQTGQREC